MARGVNTWLFEEDAEEEKSLSGDGDDGGS